MKKIILLILTFFLCFSCLKKPKSVHKGTIKIGIIQFVAHPALDRAKEGFEEQFKNDKYKVTFIEKNANAELTTAKIIASNFVREKVDLIYAIATPSAQACLSETTSIPIIFSAVTDPHDAGLIAKNITGVTDYVDILEQLKLLKQINKDIKSIGVLYNSSEANSKATINQLQIACKNLNITLVTKSVTQISEVPQAVKLLISQTDAIYTPTDNLIASVMPIITAEAIKQKKIVFGSEKAHVEGGALITKGINYYDLGKQAANMAIDILYNKKNISNLPIINMPLNDIEINKETQKKLGISLPNLK